MLNSIIIMGRLTADPELRSTSSGLSVSSFTVAVDRNYVRSGEEKKTDFINVVAWRQQADFVSKYFRKGSMIAVQGSLQTRNYEDKNGNKRVAYEIVADQISFCGSKSESGTYNNEATNASSYNNSSADDFSSVVDDDDLPF
ncbi:MAG: single-stranded DNA-binding protein [Ruminococcaceae bacterium]|nr:single-stranded DNA-binding protein [Oscillospiraceae bacterium]